MWKNLFPAVFRPSPVIGNERDFSLSQINRGKLKKEEKKKKIDENCFKNEAKSTKEHEPKSVFELSEVEI